MLTTRCKTCGGTDIQQLAEMWVPMNAADGLQEVDEVQWKGHFFCGDCKNLSPVEEKEEPDDEPEKL